VFSCDGANTRDLETALKIPARIKIAITAGERHVQGMFVMLTFAMARKNPFNLLFVPSDRGGGIEVTRDQILEEAHKSMDLFLMDYADIESYWTGKIKVTPMNREAVERALSAYRLFRKCKYPPGYEENLRTAHAALVQFREMELKAIVDCETPDPIEVESIRAIADK